MSTTPTAIALPLSTSRDTGRITFTIPIGANHPRSSVPSISGNGSDTGTHRVTYDENGQKSSSTDPRGHVATYGYDSRNRLETTTQPERENSPHHLFLLRWLEPDAGDTNWVKSGAHLRAGKPRRRDRGKRDERMWYYHH